MYLCVCSYLCIFISIKYASLCGNVAGVTLPEWNRIYMEFVPTHNSIPIVHCLPWLGRQHPNVNPVKNRGNNKRNSYTPHNNRHANGNCCNSNSSSKHTITKTTTTARTTTAKCAEAGIYAGKVSTMKWPKSIAQNMKAHSRAWERIEAHGRDGTKRI